MKVLGLAKELWQLEGGGSSFGLGSGSGYDSLVALSLFILQY